MRTDTNGNGHQAVPGVALQLASQLEPRPLVVNLGKRSRRVRRAVELSVREWNATNAELAETGDILGPIPHRQKFNVQMDAHAGPPSMPKFIFKAKYRQIVWRLVVFAAAVARWYFGRLKDKLTGKDTDENRAIRLRQIIQGMGGTAVKIGQQLAMRIDLIPYVYGVELARLFDKVPAFPTPLAIKRIEKVLGRPLGEVFAAFNPEPIGQASVACVYLAKLKNGERVAVKVRRPGIGELFVADCRALGWTLKLMEFLTLIRPGFSRNVLYEFQTMLLEELNFVREARNTELFRRRVLKKLDNVTAPRVYFDLSGTDVLTTEYVEGLWLGEMIAGIEQQDPGVLSYIREHNIDPEIVARRLIRINQFGIFENLLFHADPHPSNVLLKSNNKLVFIDFGSCGAYTTRERNNWRQLAYYQHKEDIGRMVQSALAILEPLPPIDIDDFSKKLEAVFWRDLYAFKSKHSEWWERTSARTWISFLELANEYKIPMNLNTLRMIRSTLLYETVAARLYPHIDAYREHRKYNKKAGARARKRVNRTIQKRLFGGFTNTDYLRIEQVMQMGNRFIYLAQRVLDTPPYRYSLLINKVAYGLINLYRTIRFMVISAVTIFVGFLAWRLLFEQGYTIDQFSFGDTAKQLLYYGTKLKGVWVILVLIALWLNWRRAQFRLFDKEIDRNNTSGLS